MASKTVRMSFSLPVEFQRDLNYLSSRLSITKSALLSDLLSVPLGDLRDLVASIPPQPTEDDLLRARGRSRELIQDRLKAVRDSQPDLF